jgi:hypothetical protein
MIIIIFCCYLQSLKDLRERLTMKRRRYLVALMMTAFALPLASLGADNGATPKTPQAVWEGYDPSAEPLEIEIIKT